MKTAIISISALLCGIFIIAMVVDLPGQLPRNKIPPDVAALEFVSSLGFRADKAVCGPVKFCAANCTVKVVESDKTFSLECAALENTHWRGCEERIAK